ncbi:MAG: GNAT family N-acetyltransferase [Chloroflexota bacterium]|nr:GNAT family N-acetyltransferase [Chloroflexota bacterium]MDQ5867575.1 GNAT family N-acetyltransferase [Chloroflexota bacterium]
MSTNKPDIQVRLAVPEDAPAIALVLAAAFAEYEPAYTPQAFSATTPTSEQILHRFHEGPVWVALHDSSIVGTVAAVPKGERLYVRSMGVLPSSRGKGIGGLLLRHVESVAIQHGYKSLFLSTTPFLDAAIALYEHFGFTRTSEGPHDLFGTPLFTMQNDLAAD